MDDQSIIKLDNVNVYYDKGGPAEAHALTDISLEIKQGEYAAFFGPSGSGKTTLLYVIAGMDIPQIGTVGINGRDITKYTELEIAVYRQIGVGIIFQQFNLITSLTVLDNVALPMAFLGIEISRRRQEAMRILQRLGMDAYAKRFPYELSGGQQQRVGIARALANNPPILLADEPLGNLDSENANKVLDFLKELHERDKRTIIMVTHEAWSLRDVERIFHLKDGVITSVEIPEHKNLPVGKGLHEEPAASALPRSAMAEVLARMLLRGYSMDEVKRLEFFISRRLHNEIDGEQFLMALDRPYKDGGVGLWVQRARRIAAHIEDLTLEEKRFADVKAQLEKNPETPLVEEVRLIRHWLLAEYEGQLSALRALQLDELIQERLRNIITAEQFRKVLSLSIKKFGVGLRLRAAQEIADKFEVMLGNSANGTAPPLSAM